VPAIKEARAPDFLDPIARKEWNRIAKEVIPLGYIGAADLGALAAYCSAFAEFVRADQKVQETGYLIAVKGKAVPNPWVRIRRDARLAVLKAAAELGITPSSRSRVQLLDDPDEKDKDPAREFFE
jgi:P27 family predicted phage terminase small subunit